MLISLRFGRFLESRGHAISPVLIHEEAGVGRMILNEFQIFLSSRTQRVKVDGACSSSIDVVSGHQILVTVSVCHRVVFFGPTKIRNEDKMKRNAAELNYQFDYYL